MAVSQDYVNQLVREAAAQAGGTLSYADVANAAANLGIPISQVNAAMSTGVIAAPAVADVVSQIAEPVQTVASDPSWDYGKYVESLKSGNANYSQELGKLGGSMAQNAKSLFNEITAQQKAGTADAWATGNVASKDAAAADFALRLSEAGVTSLKDVGQRTVDIVTEGYNGPEVIQQVEYFNKSTGQPLQNWDSLAQGTQSGTKLNYQIDFTPEGLAVPYTTTAESDWMGFREDFLKPAAIVAGSLLLGPQVSGLIGGATGLTGAGLGAATGATLGAGTAALTGNDILKGALLGGAGGYMSGTLAAPAQDSIYSLANGTPNLNYMGGGQGLTSTGSANLASMGGGQGLQILAGLPSTTLSEALNSFAGVNPSVLADMGLGTGITYVTPSGIVTENGTIIGGDVIGELGKNTGFDLTKWLNENVGAGIGDTLGKIDTGIGGGTPVTGVPTNTVSMPEITPGKLLDAAKLATIIGGATGVVTGNPAQTGFDIVPVPTDWKTPTYGQTGAYPGLKPIDFGSRDLLRGTQWEKYLNPAPTLAAPMQPMGMGYDQLVGALQGGQGGNLTLNDIISGIQGQYGQTPSGTVG